MLEKIIMIVSAGLMLANEMLGLGYDKVEITAAVALIATIVAAAVRRLHGEAAAAREREAAAREREAGDRLREKELDLKLRVAEVQLLESHRGCAGAERAARREP